MVFMANNQELLSPGNTLRHDGALALVMRKSAHSLHVGRSGGMRVAQPFAAVRQSRNQIQSRQNLATKRRKRTQRQNPCFVGFSRLVAVEEFLRG